MINQELPRRATALCALRAMLRIGYSAAPAACVQESRNGIKGMNPEARPRVFLSNNLTRILEDVQVLFLSS